MSKLSLIAIDGPSGVGKSTTAKQVAQELGWDYLDTGAMYRATALALQRTGVALSNRTGLEKVLAGLRIQQRGAREFLGDEDISALIRTAGGWVVDGRDIGTVVFPEACCKIFLTASVAARAGRRCRELEEQGQPQPLAEVAADIQRRDQADCERAVSPLRRAADAVELDSSAMTLAEVVAWIVARHRTH